MHIAWGSFLLALLVIVVVPGPDFVLVTRNAATGTRWGWLAAAGTTCGLLVHATAATLGLSALVVAVPAALLVVKVIGVAYLAWMGLQIVRKAGTGADERWWPLPRPGARSSCAGCSPTCSTRRSC